jgi:translation initiation factor IF-3
VDIAKAKALAQEASLDLVEIAPNADPPVVKIVDWGKYRYSQMKQAQKARKNQKTQQLKQVRFGVKIGQHDLNVKINKIHKFINQGSKVRLSVFFRGREITHPEIGEDLLKKVMEELGNTVTVDSKPLLTGKYLNMIIHKK